MFFVTYLRRELRHRMRQAVFIALGLAVGVGLVVTVSAASAAVARAESTVLAALDGAGTDVTVTAAVVGKTSPGAAQRGNASIPQSIELTPAGAQGCGANGKCASLAGTTLTTLQSPYTGISAPQVTAAARLPGVTAAAGGITILGSVQTFPEGGGLPQTAGYTLDGVDTADTSLGPLGSATLVSGRGFTAAEADASDAVLDSGYAASHRLKTGSAITIGQARYTVIGIVSQSQAGNPPSIYIPLARAQSVPLDSGTMTGQVNRIYLTAASAADVNAVSKEVAQLLPGTTVTTAGSLASQVTGSLNTAARLAGDLGRWVSALVLAAAFAMACLLSMAAVSRRAQDFGILKALGWRSRRIVAQVLGECGVLGVAGAVAGTGLGYAGAAIIAALAPTVSATAGSAELSSSTPSAPRLFVGGTALIHEVPVPLHPSVSDGTIGLAVALALAGALLAGAFASWRSARLRPADALTRVS